MNDHCTGIILKQSDYREYDAIFTVLTKEYGKLSFVASGIKKMKSKNARSLLPYTICDIQFDYRPGKTMFRLKTSQTLSLFKNCHDDLNLSICAGIACQLADQFVLQEYDVNTTHIYDMLAYALTSMNDLKDPITVLTLFSIDLMAEFGIQSEVDSCVHCGNTNVSYFSSKEGGFLCYNCASQLGYENESATDLKRMRLLVKGGLTHLDIILGAGGAKMKDLEKMIEMIHLHAGIYVKSFRLLKGLY